MQGDSEAEYGVWCLRKVFLQCGIFGDTYIDIWVYGALYRLDGCAAAGSIGGYHKRWCWWILKRLLVPMYIYQYE